MRYPAIKCLMQDIGLPQYKMAEILKITQGNLSLKLNGKRPLFMDEARVIQKTLAISDTDFVHYFYEGH